MSEIIKTEQLTLSYPPDEGKEPVQALLFLLYPFDILP